MNETSKQNIERSERLKRRNEFKLQMELPKNKKVKIDTTNELKLQTNKKLEIDTTTKKRFRHKAGFIDDNPLTMVYNSPTKRDIPKIKAQDIYDTYTYNICV